MLKKSAPGMLEPIVVPVRPTRLLKPALVRKGVKAGLVNTTGAEAELPKINAKPKLFPSEEPTSTVRFMV